MAKFRRESGCLNVACKEAGAPVSLNREFIAQNCLWLAAVAGEQKAFDNLFLQA